MDPVSGFALSSLSPQAGSIQQRDHYRATDDPHAQFAFTQDAYSDSPTIGGNLGIIERHMLPKVGQTRCYWALLNTSLQFIFPDPVLRYHLQEQVEGFLKCSLLDFVHPDEQDSARRDLGSVLEERTLHGSVTRVRYCRLSRVRRILGWSDSSLPYPPGFPAERIAIDADYMAVYLVVNCVAEDLVLCFIHAVVDIAPRADNDEFHKTGWTNWCSTYGFEEEQARALYRRLYESTMTVSKSLELGYNNSLRILQILRNEPGRQLVITWPPEVVFLQAHQTIPKADILARLARNVHISGSMGDGGNNDARTSCTRRYKSIETIEISTPEGSKTFQVESIFIPHGTVIFACHKVNIIYFHTEDAHLPSDYRESAHSPKTSGSGYREAGGFDNQTFTIPSLLTPHHELPVQNYVQQWVDGQSHPMHLSRGEYKWGGVTMHADPQGLNAASINSAQPGCDPQCDEDFFQDSWRKKTLATEKSSPTDIGTSDARTLTSIQNESFESIYGIPPSTSLLATSTPFTIQMSRSGKRGSRSPSHEDEKSIIVSKDRLLREHYNGCGKGSGNPPVGVSGCAHCNASQSPEWRKGPSGKKDLCNACGLRFARSKAKKDGVVSRKRKEKELTSNGQACLPADLDSPTTPAGYREGLIAHSQNLTSHSSNGYSLQLDEPTRSQQLSTPTSIIVDSYLF